VDGRHVTDAKPPDWTVCQYLANVRVAGSSPSSAPEGPVHIRGLQGDSNASLLPGPKERGLGSPPTWGFSSKRSVASSRQSRTPSSRSRSAALSRLGWRVRAAGQLVH